MKDTKESWDLEADPIDTLSFERLFDLALDLLCIADTEGRFRRVNPAFERVLGWTPEQLTSQPFYSFVHPDDLEATQAEVKKLARGEPTIKFENRYRCANGSYRFLRWNSAPDPETGLLYATARDATGQKRLQAELVGAKQDAEAADRAKSLFLARMSHEIRTPMNGILGMTELAYERAEDARVRSYLDIVRGSSEHLLRLLDDLLDLSRMEAGRLQLIEEPFDLHAVVHLALKSLAVEAHGKGLSLGGLVDPDVPRRVHGDAVRLRQILVNLLGNAVKFTDRGHVVLQVSAEPVELWRSEFRFAVRDTGPGIPEEQRSTIFDSFWQVTPTASSRQGAGLGLSISSQLAALMGGSLHVADRDPVGSEISFVVRLPLVEEQDELCAAQRLEGRRVVLVEPDVATTWAVGAWLDEWSIDWTEKTVAEVDDMSPSTRDILVCNLAASSACTIDWLQARRRAHGDEATVALIETVRADGLLEALEREAVCSRLKPMAADELLSALLEASGLAMNDPEVDEPGPLTGLEILLVEDTEINRQVAIGLLELAGHRVHVVESGLAALRELERADASAFDLVLMDVELPGIDGLETTRRIRALGDDAWSELPIVALTAQATREDQKRCQEAGMNAFVSKPLRRRRLTRAIAYAMGIHSETGGEAQEENGETIDDSLASLAPPGEAISATSSPDAIEWEEALAVAGGSQALLTKIVTAATREVPKLFAMCEQAIAAGERAEVKRCAHSLKSSTGYFGASALNEVFASLERSSSERALEELRVSLNEAKPLVDSFVSELGSYLHSRNMGTDHE